jgi:hypothetical protein
MSTTPLDDADRYALEHGHIHIGPDGSTVTNIVRPKNAGKDKPPGRLAAWLLTLLAAGLFVVSFAGQYQYIVAARHQKIAAVIESAMFDLGMIIFAKLAFDLARAGQSARTERALVVACSIGSAGMNYLAADTASPRSVVAYTTAPVFLAVVVDRVVAVVRRLVSGNADGSPWQVLGRGLARSARLTGLVLLYTLRITLARGETWRGLRQSVLNAAPLPEIPAPEPDSRGPQTKKALLLAAYRAHPHYGNRGKVSKVAAELAPAAGLQSGTARSYLYDYLRSEPGRGAS